MVMAGNGSCIGLSANKHWYKCKKVKKKKISIFGARDASSRALSLLVVVMAAWCYDGNGGAGNGSCIEFSVNKR